MRNGHNGDGLDIWRKAEGARDGRPKVLCYNITAKIGRFQQYRPIIPQPP